MRWHLNNIQFDVNQTKLTLVQSNPGKAYNWLFLAGGPGAGSEYLKELINVLNCPGNIWLIDLPENGENMLGDQYDEHYDFDTWEFALKHVLKSFHNGILVGHSFGGMYPLLFPDIEKDLTGLVLLNAAARPWRQNACEMGEKKHLPSFKKEIEAFLSHETAENFDQFRKIIVHYFFSPENLQRGEKSFFGKAFNFHATHWWISKVRTIDFEKIFIPHIPTLILGASDDCTVPFKAFLEDTRFQKSNILMKEIQGASHFPWLEKPEEVQRAFEQFIEKLGLS